MVQYTVQYIGMFVSSNTLLTSRHVGFHSNSTFAATNQCLDEDIGTLNSEKDQFFIRVGVPKTPRKRPLPLPPDYDTIHSMALLL